MALTGRENNSYEFQLYLPIVRPFQFLSCSVQSPRGSSPYGRFSTAHGATGTLHILAARSRLPRRRQAHAGACVTTFTLTLSSTFAKSLASLSRSSSLKAAVRAQGTGVLGRAGGRERRGTAGGGWVDRGRGGGRWENGREDNRGRGQGGV